ncbi:MAG: YMGG-like glycine zipper-containing protein [Flavitalea sp.]
MRHTLATGKDFRAQTKEKTVVDNGDGTKTVTNTKIKKNCKGKYALIGAGAGAASGVAVSKNNSKGAIIGGATGASGGYLYGSHRDKKKPKTKTVQKTKLLRPGNTM